MMFGDIRISECVGKLGEDSSFDRGSLNGKAPMSEVIASVAVTPNVAHQSPSRLWCWVERLTRDIVIEI